MTTHTVATTAADKEANLVDAERHALGGLDAPLDITGRVVVNFIGRPGITGQ